MKTQINYSSSINKTALAGQASSNVPVFENQNLTPTAEQILDELLKSIAVSEDDSARCRAIRKAGDRVFCACNTPALPFYMANYCRNVIRNLNDSLFAV